MLEIQDRLINKILALNTQEQVKVQGKELELKDSILTLIYHIRNLGVILIILINLKTIRIRFSSKTIHMLFKRNMTLINLAKSQAIITIHLNQSLRMI